MQGLLYYGDQEGNNIEEPFILGEVIHGREGFNSVTKGKGI